MSMFDGVCHSGTECAIASSRLQTSEHSDSAGSCDFSSDTYKCICKNGHSQVKYFQTLFKSV